MNAVADFTLHRSRLGSFVARRPSLALFQRYGEGGGGVRGWVGNNGLQYRRMPDLIVYQYEFPRVHRPQRFQTKTAMHR